MYFNQSPTFDIRDYRLYTAQKKGSQILCLYRPDIGVIAIANSPNPNIRPDLGYRVKNSEFNPTDELTKILLCKLPS